MKTIDKEPWWSFTLEKIIHTLNGMPDKGLSDQEVQNSRKKYGSNVIAFIKQKSISQLIWEGITQPMMLLLLSISGLSFLFGKFVESFAMFVVIIAYVSVELFNNYRSDKVMTALKKLATPYARVRRNSTIIEINKADIVVGDILIVSEGTLIPADARLISSYGLLVNEASLTGESLPIQKDASIHLEKQTPLSNRINSIFSGTIVLDGEGTAIITAVGASTELGQIAKKVQITSKKSTLLQNAMTKLAKILAIFAIIASALIPAIGYIKGQNLHEMILTWLSLTFLMIPGQPPIIITMALALAAFRLAQINVIAKKLTGIEFIGQVTAIVSDKTGTITESIMKLESFYTLDGLTKTLTPEESTKIALAIPAYTTDPSDIAVLEALSPYHNESMPIGFSGFSTNKPWRTIMFQKGNMILHAIAGSPDIILKHADLSARQQEELFDTVHQYAQQGKRIIAYASYESTNKNTDLNTIHFVALAIISDPIRPGVKDAITILEQAKVHTFIVTGDHKNTAETIAQKIGITGQVITGKDVQEMTDQELASKLDSPTIFAQIDPMQKLRIVDLLQKNGKIVAAIGDGVNDAPALKSAQVGIAMGKIGTDLAQEVSDLILTDDNYIHIPDAIKIGRTALDNFKKGLTYYLSAKSILLIAFILPLILGIPFPFSPIQIIIIELLMDLASSTIFVTEESEKGIMNQPAPRMTDFLGFSLIAKIILYGFGLAAAIPLIYLYTYTHYDLVTAQTAALVAWLLGHILLAFNMKQIKEPVFMQGLFSNYFALFWFIGMLTLTIVITTITPLYPYLNTTKLPLPVWCIIFIAIVPATCWVEIKKRLVMNRQ